MLENINNQRLKTIQNFSKKQSPISILTSENTIFIKTNPNKLTSNYLRNGNQIKHNKNILSTTINQYQNILNNSNKNTFSLKNSNFDKNNLKDINNKLKKILNNDKFRRNNYKTKEANSFLNLYGKSKNNFNSISIINKFNNNSHNFNFYKMTEKLNNTSVKRKQNIENRLINNNNNINENERNKFNSTIIIDTKNSISKHNKKKSSINKNSKMNNLSFFQKYYSNNSLNLKDNDNIYCRTLNDDNNNVRNNSRIKKYLYNPKKINKKYIYSIERKKEKSLAERRQKAKKPISFLIKNNYVKKIENSKNRNEIIVNLNKLKKIGKPFKTKNIEHKRIDYKNGTYNNINAESKSSMKNMKILNMNTIEFDNFKFNKISPVNNKNETREINKHICSEPNFYENNNIVNNNYYNINNTFILDTFGNKINQYNLTKLINKNNYNKQNNFQTIEIERNKNNIIKNKKKIKENKPNKIIKNKNSNYLGNYLTSKNSNNKKIDIKKLSNPEILNINKDKIGNNYFHILTKNLNIKNKYNKIVDEYENKNKEFKTLNYKNNLNLENKNNIIKKIIEHNTKYQQKKKKKKVII